METLVIQVQWFIIAIWIIYRFRVMVKMAENLTPWGLGSMGMQILGMFMCFWHGQILAAFLVLSILSLMEYAVVHWVKEDAFMRPHYLKTLKHQGINPFGFMMLIGAVALETLWIFAIWASAGYSFTIM